MSRAVHENNVEQIQRIEAEIAHLLSQGDPAIVDKGTIENGYSVLDASEGEMTGTLREKCTAIVSVLNDKYALRSEYSVMDGTVRFVKCRPR